MNIEGYKEICFVDSDIYDNNTDHVKLETENGSYIGTADLSEIIDKLIDLEKADIHDDDRKNEVISQKVSVSPGGEFIITEINISGEFGTETTINSVDVKGYVLR